ncbi:ABC transporter ATP-binding protein [Kitasatospora terrestris]|uniref:ABC transporter ATP-binding protein n=1 Tax=Kitasatospora terrestris TaxID=258051 RepID=A0ABP9E9E7_9ACTN
MTGAGGLAAHGVVRRYGGITAVDGVDLAAPPGRVTALIGPNGAGKSTLFDCLAGTVRPDAGRVLLAGRDVTALPDHARARLGLLRTFQQIAAFQSLTVAENVRIGAEQVHGGLARGLLGLPPGEGRQRTVQENTERALRLLDLRPVRDWPADRLPTGALRLLELARALAAAPHVLLLDEPAAGLDQAQTARLTGVLRALAAEGTALLVVEHDVDLVAELADTVYVMAAGKVVAHGPAARVLADPEVAAAWGAA